MTGTEELAGGDDCGGELEAWEILEIISEIGVPDFLELLAQAVAGSEKIISKT